MKKSPINPVSVGRRIREIRKNLGLSMADFALRIDEKAKSGTVSNWEMGKNLPNNQRLKRIAELGGISIDKILYGSTTEYLFENFDIFVSEDKDYIPSITTAWQLRKIAEIIEEDNIQLSNYDEIEKTINEYIPIIEKEFLNTFNKSIVEALANPNYMEETLTHLKTETVLESFFDKFEDTALFVEYLKQLHEKNFYEKVKHRKYLEEYISHLYSIKKGGFLTDSYPYQLDWDEFLTYSQNPNMSSLKEYEKVDVYYRYSNNFPEFNESLLIPSDDNRNKLLFVPVYPKEVMTKKFIDKKCFILIDNQSYIGTLISENKIIDTNTNQIKNIENYNFLAPIIVEFY